MSENYYLGSSVLKSYDAVADRSGGTTEYCETTMLERVQSRHRALNDIGSSQSPALSSQSKTGSVGADKGDVSRRGIRRTDSLDYTIPLQAHSLASSLIPPRPIDGPTDVIQLLEKQRSSSADSIPLIQCYNNGFVDSTRNQLQKTIRFQVVVWHIGQIDMVQGRVPITFRVTIFWNAPSDVGCSMNKVLSQNRSLKRQKSWRMLGRQQAFQVRGEDIDNDTVDVPPLSILNAVTFETIGDPEICMLRKDSKLMQWSCMYRAMLFQEHWEVDNFPHDEHEISVRLAVLAQRQSGSRWDRHVWKLSLATADDSQESLRIPHGLAMDHVSIPGFLYNKSKGLQFEFTPLDHGPGGGTVRRDTCLEVKLQVLRNSSYYDRNIMPLLGMLNLVAISITSLDADQFFERALIALDIAFVEIGMRMTVDSKLPTASYQIKMQRILNEYFFGLLFLVFESLLVYELRKHSYDTVATDTVDWFAALAVFFHNIFTLFTYYSDARRVGEHILLNMS